MKNGRSYRHPSHPASTHAALSLPPRRPSATRPRPEPEVARAIPLPDLTEPLVTSDGEAPGPSAATRQLRRQARRAQAKAQRRNGAHRAPPKPTYDAVPTIVTASLAARLTPEPNSGPQATANDAPASNPVKPDSAADDVAHVASAAEDPQDAAGSANATAFRPLPFAADPTAEAPPTTDTAPLPRARSLTVRPSGLLTVVSWMRSLVIRKPRRERIAPAHAVREIQAMRSQLAHMQKTLDRMLDRTG